MLGLHLLNQRCTVKRLNEVLDEYRTPRTPTPDDWAPVGSYPCRLSKSNTQTTQEQPRTTTVAHYVLYLPPYANIQAGDLVVVQGSGTYRASAPYTPNGHHIEVEVEWDGET